ncbi:MAG: MFS transporter [Chthoniobacterales bacterium]|nr:MFS transporter [Chthoniobacterales bacterium]
MSNARRSNPITYLFLLLPYGISNGFCSITLPYALVQHGFSVAAAASIVALGLSANIWRFVGAPVVDLTLSLRSWYLIGLTACVASLIGVGAMTLRPKTAVMLTIVVFVSQVGSNLVVIPVGGFIAHTVREEEKGRAAGWYQAGNLGGTGIGGGIGVWIVSQFSFFTAGVTLAAAMIVAALALRFVPDVRPFVSESVGHRIRLMGRDLLDLLRTPIGLLTAILVTSPIGSGAMNNLWSAVAPDWHTGVNTVALVTGVLNGVVGALGCIVGGWMTDRVGRWWAYFGSGVFLAIVAVGMAIAARSSSAFSAGVLAYAFVGGVAYAAFSALVLFAIGRGAASTKYALLSSFGNLPVIYVTAMDGWSHDRYGSAGMLYIEALAGIVAVLLAAVAVWHLRRRAAIPR